jgi:hypothetical protein
MRDWDKIGVKAIWWFIGIMCFLELVFLNDRYLNHLDRIQELEKCISVLQNDSKGVPEYIEIMRTQLSQLKP